MDLNGRTYFGMPSVSPASMTLYLFLEKVTHSIMCSKLKSTVPFEHVRLVSHFLARCLCSCKHPGPSGRSLPTNPASLISSYRHIMSSMLFRAIVTPFHLLLDWPKSLFIFFCKVLWESPMGPLANPILVWALFS